MVEKIKDLARVKVNEETPKEIDYFELVRQIKRNDSMRDEPQPPDQDPNTEPDLLPFAAHGTGDWSNIVSFMRDNPKLLMQMIPDDGK